MNRKILRMTSLALCVLAISPVATAAPTEVNQKAPSLADTPGVKSEIAPFDLSAADATFKHGLVLLNSSVLLKVYYYAYAGIPVDYSEILTDNTEHIVKPLPVVPDEAKKQVIDKLIQQAKTHPDVLISLDDIALDAYDKTARSYPIENRLFINGTKYYFDNSPYHYLYDNAASFRKLGCPDAKMRAVIDADIANYEHFKMELAGHVSTAKDKTLAINLRKFTLKDAAGQVLVTHGKQD